MNSTLNNFGDSHLKSLFDAYFKCNRPALFSYFEYFGSDFDSDMAKMAADPTTQKWWDVCKPCQRPLESRNSGEWWANMEEVFHQD
jgi:L-rhamnose mutarotase